MEHYALAAQVFGVGLIFARVGGFIMLMPGVGETAVPAPVRLAFAFMLALTLYPIVHDHLPPEPAGVGELAGLIVLEIAIGLGMGALLRMFMAALLTTGEIISLQTTLAMAQTTNPLQAQPSVTIGSFLSLLGLTLVFATDLHQVFIAGIVDSYRLFPIGRGAHAQDFGLLAIETFGRTFALGVQLAAPVMVFAMAFNVGLGMVARIMPQFQVFAAATPLILVLGLSVFAVSVGTIGLVWLDRTHAFADRLL
ncbi:MAG: flagellar biosynthetic protein FliR [Caulobacteraceae bacterium]